jgi:hypothetical protein
MPNHSEGVNITAFFNSPSLRSALPTQPATGATRGEILDVRGVAELLKVPVSWVYEHTRPRCPNPIPCFKMGKYLRFYRADIYAYLTCAFTVPTSTLISIAFDPTGRSELNHDSNPGYPQSG